MNNEELKKILNNKKIKLFIVIACIIYVLSPYDVVPDFIPIGRFDDLIAMFICSLFCYSLYSQINNEKNDKLRFYFSKEYPEVDSKFTDLLDTIGEDEKYKFYKKEALNVFGELLKVFSNILEANSRIIKLGELNDKLSETLNNKDESDRAKEGIAKSKELITRIGKEIKELESYVTNAKEEIKATGLDFIHVCAEIELSKGSGQLFEPVKLASRSKSLSYIASNLPVTTGLS